MSTTVSAEKLSVKLTATAISDNVYSIIAPAYGLPTPQNQGWNANSYFIVTDAGVLVFDTGSSERIGREIKRVIKSVTDKPVRWLVNSHSHADHWLGNAAFIGSNTDTNVEIIASKASLATMKTDGQPSADFFFRATKGATGKTNLSYPTSFTTKKQRRYFGDIEVEFLFSDDGHSPGDIMLWLPEQKIILGGDVLNSDWMPLIIDHGNVDNLIKSLEQVAKLKPAIVLPGHGSPTTAQSVTRDAKLLTQVVKWVSVAKTNGKNQDEVLALVTAKLAPKYRTLYKNFDVGIEQQVQAIYSLY